jgi:alkylation response protein AidB-like acyl-CoA dehydrogenase
MTSSSPPSLRAVEVANFDALLDRLSAELAGSAQLFDESGAFPHANFKRLHEHGLLALTVPKALGGGGASLAQARKAISAIAKGEPSTALILVMQYLQHTRLQDSKTWPAHLRVKVAEDAVRHGALINALRVEPDLGTPARGGLPATTAVRSPEGWRISGRKLYSTGSHGLSWFSVWARSDDADPLVGAWLVPKNSPGISIIDSWDHLGMRATCSHDVVFDNVLVPLDHAVSVSPWSAPQPELDAEGLLWMSVLLSSVYDAVAQAARDWLVNWLQTRQPSNLGAALATLPRFQETVGHIDTLLFANRSLLDAAAEGHTPAGNAAQLAIEASGNPGLSRHSPLQRHYRDVLCSRVHTPQNDAVLQGVGKAAFAQRQKERT